MIIFYYILLIIVRVVEILNWRHGLRKKLEDKLEISVNYRQLKDMKVSSSLIKKINGLQYFVQNTVIELRYWNPKWFYVLKTGTFIFFSPLVTQIFVSTSHSCKPVLLVLLSISFTSCYDLDRETINRYHSTRLGKMIRMWCKAYVNILSGWNYIIIEVQKTEKMKARVLGLFDLSNDYIHF